LGDPARRGRLRGVVDELHQQPSRLRKGDPGSAPGLEKPCLARDGKAPLTGLEVEHQRQNPIGGRDLCPRVPRQRAGVALVAE
jgi:hypothetical protein